MQTFLDAFLPALGIACGLGLLPCVFICVEMLSSRKRKKQVQDVSELQVEIRNKPADVHLRSGARIERVKFLGHTGSEPDWVPEPQKVGAAGLGKGCVAVDFDRTWRHDWMKALRFQRDDGRVVVVPVDAIDFLEESPG
jgi:hypothetical protein